MIKRVLLLLLLLACSKAPEEATDTREPIDIRYVGGAQAAVHARADDKSPVVTRYQHSESVPILSRKGEWVEVRTAMGSGWVHQTDLVGAEQAAQSGPTRCR